MNKKYTLSWKNKSVLFFTLHRCASMFIYKICGDLAKLKGLKYYSPNGGDFLFNEVTLAKNPDMFKDKIGFFAPIRFFVNMANLKESNVILHLRDPRDMLVSMFYAYCYSHRGPVKGYTGYRKKIADEGIDNFCLRMVREGVPTLIGDYGTGGHIKEFAGNILRRYEDYANKLLKKPDVTLIKYEEMVTNFNKWLSKLVSALDFDNEEEIIKMLYIKYKNEFVIERENIYSHKRKIVPGDYKGKLKPSTIKELNITFGNVLKELKYDE